MAQTLKEMEKKEEKKEKQQKEEKQEDPKPTKSSGKKWKGKDWYVILAPEMFNSVAIGETPATDPKTLAGRVIEVGLSEFTNQQTKYYMKLFFEVTGVSGKSVSTQFAGYEALREHITRFIRKRSGKIQVIENFKTKDGWDLQFTITAISMKATEAGTATKVRKAITDVSEKHISGNGLEKVVKSIITGTFQRDLKKSCNKVYPIRFLEVEKIEVASKP